MSRPRIFPTHTVVVVLAAGLSLAGCAGGPNLSLRKSPTPVTSMEPIPNPPEPAARATAPATPTPRRAAPRQAAPQATPAPARAPTVQPNRARAAQLRAAGLEQLNRGAIDGAVTLLRQASQLDPGNALIQRDLERALRVSNAVRAKSR